VLGAINNKFINSAHDISEGGIISALAECCIMNDENRLGAEVDIPVKSREDYSFFSESQSRIIISLSEEKKEDFEKFAKEFSTPVYLLGKVTEKDLKVNGKYKISTERLADLYYNTIPNKMNVTV
jgi:phosphoribosylformylglycinamidine synthase